MQYFLFELLFWSVFCSSFCSDQFLVLIFFWKHWHGRRDPGPFSFLSSTWTWRKNHPGRFMLQKWKIGNINTSLIAAIFGCGWVNWAQICSPLLLCQFFSLQLENNLEWCLPRGAEYVAALLTGTFLFGQALFLLV